MALGKGESIVVSHGHRNLVGDDIAVIDDCAGELGAVEGAKAGEGSCNCSGVSFGHRSIGRSRDGEAELIAKETLISSNAFGGAIGLNGLADNSWFILKSFKS